MELGVDALNLNLEVLTTYVKYCIPPIGWPGML